MGKKAERGSMPDLLEAAIFFLIPFDIYTYRT
jgi:hypothetical protein